MNQRHVLELGRKFASLPFYPCGNQNCPNLDGLNESLEEVTSALTRADVLCGGCPERFSPKRCPILNCQRGAAALSTDTYAQEIKTLNLPMILDFIGLEFF